MKKYILTGIFSFDMSPPSSRRRFLALCATGSAASLAGCGAVTSSDSEVIQSASGLVWQKKVEVKLVRPDSNIWVDILRLQFDREENRLFGGFDPDYLKGAVNDASVTISSETHSQLTVEFGQLRYGVKLGPINEDGDHLHARARRDAFNGLRLAGDASVENFWVQATDDRRVGYVRPTKAEPPRQSPFVDLDQFDISEFYKD